MAGNTCLQRLHRGSHEMLERETVLTFDRKGANDD